MKIANIFILIFSIAGLVVAFQNCGKQFTVENTNMSSQSESAVQSVFELDQGNGLKISATEWLYPQAKNRLVGIEVGALASSQPVRVVIYLQPQESIVRIDASNATSVALAMTDKSRRTVDPSLWSYANGVLTILDSQINSSTKLLIAIQGTSDIQCIRAPCGPGGSDPGVPDPIDPNGPMIPSTTRPPVPTTTTTTRPPTTTTTIPRLCEPNSTAPCNVENGLGVKTCSPTGSYYAGCVATTCNANFSLMNGFCLANTCGSGFVSNASTACPSDDRDVPASLMPWTLAGGDSSFCTSGRKCESYCSGDYYFDGKTNTCAKKCTPGNFVTCTTSGGKPGISTCSSDGKGFGVCTDPNLPGTKDCGPQSFATFAVVNDVCSDGRQVGGQRGEWVTMKIITSSKNTEVLWVKKENLQLDPVYSIVTWPAVPFQCENGIYVAKYYVSGYYGPSTVYLKKTVSCN